MTRLELPMHVVVRDQDGDVLCRCSLDELIAANEFDDGDLGALRTRIAKGESWSCGGGAAAFFVVAPE